MVKYLPDTNVLIPQPSHETEKLVRKHGVDKKARTFTPWSHVMALISIRTPACRRIIADEPREFGFSAEGYERKNILVTDDTPPTATVELEPKN